ncbi:MAG: hypothetical protein QM813_16575 [Verrucomicrobiota bacterium]
MKNTKLFTIAIAVVSTTLALAQETDVIRERVPVPLPEDVLIDPGFGGQPMPLIAADRRTETAKAQVGARKTMTLAQAGGGAFGAVSGEAGDDVFVASPFAVPSSRSPRALVIPKDAGDPKSFAEVEEDLGVMAHILSKALNSDDKAARAMGIAVFGRASVAGASPQNLYIEGHGAIFLLNVSIPLQPPPNKDLNLEAKEQPSNEWEEAKREMSRPGGKGQGGADPFMAFEERFGGEPWNVKLPVAEYDADKVEKLKADVITALKNAANIRRLKSDETVTVVVSSGEAGVLTKSFKSAGGKPGTTKTERVVIAKSSSGEQRRVDSPAKLIFRVKKADAEAFQTGKLDFDAFRKKVAVLSI